MYTPGYFAKPASIAGLLLAAAAFGAAAPVAAATTSNLITDGSFENFRRCYNCWNGSDGHTVDWGARQVRDFALIDQTAGTYGPTQVNWSGYFSYNLSAAMAKGGWLDYYGKTVHLHGAITSSPSGGNFIAMSMTDGVLSQTLSGLTLGQTYEVSFYSAAAICDAYEGSPWNYTNVSADIFAKVGFDKTSVTTPAWQTDEVHAASSQAWSPWALNTLQFTATDVKQKLSFKAGYSDLAGGGAPPLVLLLDGISVTAVPEPEQWAMYVGGLLLLAGLRLRNRRARA